MPAPGRPPPQTPPPPFADAPAWLACNGTSGNSTTHYIDALRAVYTPGRVDLNGSALWAALAAVTPVGAAHATTLTVQSSALFSGLTLEETRGRCT
jgi:hypothetical protein